MPFDHDDDLKVADYFVVAGLTDTSTVQDVELPFPTTNHKINTMSKDPITDICIIDKTIDEQCPQGFTCIEKTPSGLLADLNHGSFTAHNIFLCYRRGRDKPPLVDLGVYYEGLETVKNGISIIETTPSGKSANVNNKSGMGSFPIYITFRRAEASAPQSSLVVTDICVILTNKNEYPPYAYCLIDKNLNKGMIGSSVFLCYKKSMRKVNSISFKPGFLGRYPTEDNASFPLPATVPLFCLPMGATIECWSNETKHPLPSFSSFVLTLETSDKIYGAVISFYEPYPEEKLEEEHKYTLGLLRGDGHRTIKEKTVHTLKAICMLSRWPLFDAFRDFLTYLYRLTVSPIVYTPIERHIAHFINNVPFPSPQRPRVHYQMSPMLSTTLVRPQVTPIPLSGASFLALLDDLGAENTLTLITLALTEHKIVVHSLRRAEVTRVSEALITLLFPFKWQCTYVPLCPLEMAYVLEAPCPFIVGVDSRYFDMYEPPSDVTCVNLDTNSITQIYDKKWTWKMLPRKPAKHARNILQALFKEIKTSCPRRRDDEGEYLSKDPETSRTGRHAQIEIVVQETILKFMAVIMKDYRNFLLPITEAPSIGTTDPSSLFSIQDFIKSQEKSSQRFFTTLMGTQLFAAFIETRSFSSFSTGYSNDGAGKAAGLVFFDECIDRLGGDFHDNVRLIEPDDTLKSERTIFVMPPDEKGLPSDVGYRYTTFPELQKDLFTLGSEQDEEGLDSNPASKGGTLDKQRRRSGTFVIGRRTKQEAKVTQKQAKLYSGSSQMWARFLLSTTYSVWYGCLTELVRQSNSKAAILRAGHDVLYLLKEKGCIPLPDETCYRVLMHLCCLYNKPVLAVRIFHFVRDSRGQLSAITYGLYNKAVLESTWPSSNRDGYMLWQKLRNVLIATSRLWRLLRQSDVNSAGGMSDNRSDFDSSSHYSTENSATYSAQQEIAEESTDLVNLSTESDEAEQQTFERSVQPPTTLSFTTVHDLLEGGDNHSISVKKHESSLNSTPQNGNAANINVDNMLAITPEALQKLGTPVSDSSRKTGTPSTNKSSPDPLLHGRCKSIVRSAAEVSPLATPINDGPNESEVFSKHARHEQKGKPRAWSNPPRIVSPVTPENFMTFDDNSNLPGTHLELDEGQRKSHRLRSASAHITKTRVNDDIATSPSIGQKSPHGDSGVILSEEHSLRNNFDSMTADDIAKGSPSPSHGIPNFIATQRRKSGNRIHSPISPVKPEFSFENEQLATFKNVKTSDQFVSENGAGDAPDHVKSETDDKLSKTSEKQVIKGKDVTHLALDPLSPVAKVSVSQTAVTYRKEPSSSKKTDSGSRHLVDEIEQYMNKDDRSQVNADNSSEDANCSSESGVELKEDNIDHRELQRRISSPGVTTPKHPSPGLLTRSLTFAQGSTTGLLSSGSKLNNLFRATTKGMASKAKQLASNLAKDINETVQSNLAYYTPEKFKGSLSELGSQDDMGSRSHLRKSRDELYSSQSSLRSSDSKHSLFGPSGSFAFKGTADVEKRTKKDERTSKRPLSMPPSNASDTVSSQKAGNINLSQSHLATSINSLNARAVCDLDITISSCSKCQRCSSLVYDEEIMAGWMADESNLNTHCPFCNTLFVPLLHVQIKDYRRIKMDAEQNADKSLSDVTSIDDEILSSDDNSSISKEVQTTKHRLTVPSQTTTEGAADDDAYTVMEPFTIPYLSPLVLRKELESLLENEGTRVLGESEFVDHHPIVYWNFVWYFKRLKLHSNLYNLVLTSKLVNKETENFEKEKKDVGAVFIHLMWDNPSLHQDMMKPPLYMAYLQLNSANPSSEYNMYPVSFLEDMKQSIIADDVRGPLVALLNEFSAHNYSNSQVRRSTYREILFLVIVALGKDSIDVDAYDRVYKEAYDSLTMQELHLTRKCDKPVNDHIRECRNMFGEPDLW